MNAYQALQQKRQFIQGKVIVGIAPAKAKHQAVVLDVNGLQMGKSFCVPVSHDGYHQRLWQKLGQVLPTITPEQVVFAIETACNLWPTLAASLHNQGSAVLFVSPLSTHHTRPLVNHDFSRTDPKDALLVASNARDGDFDFYRPLAPPWSALHHLSITYHKLRKTLAQTQARLRAHLEQLFPEFISVLDPATDTAHYLLSKYLLPAEYLRLDRTAEATVIARISRHQHGLETLQRLHQVAQTSIGVPRTPADALADRLTVDSWLALWETVDGQVARVTQQLIVLAKPLPDFAILTSLKGISDLSAALFLAETLDLGDYRHAKQLEKRAGLNIRLADSGQYTGRRRISKLGNRRLRWLLYRMTEETVKYIPEVRLKYLTRQVHRPCHRKNVIAATSTLLQLILALVKAHRPYQERPEAQQRVQQLEQQYARLHPHPGGRTAAAHAA